MGCGSGVTSWRRLRDWQEAGAGPLARAAAREAASSRPDRLLASRYRIIIDSRRWGAPKAGPKISNLGVPLIDVDRFLDAPPRSHNEALASLMRRFGICEECGSGVDKVVHETKFYQLPVPEFAIAIDSTRAFLFAHRTI